MFFVYQRGEKKEADWNLFFFCSSWARQRRRNENRRIIEL